MSSYSGIAKRGLAAAVVVRASVCACSQGGPTSAKAEANKTIGLQLSIVDYADDGVDAYVKGSWTGSMGGHSGGGSFTCCISLPAQWSPGMTVSVRYQNETMYKADSNSFRTVSVPVEPYTERQGISAILWLFYLGGEKFKVYVSGAAPSAPQFPDHWDWPAPGPKSNRITDPTVSPKS